MAQPAALGAGCSPVPSMGTACSTGAQHKAPHEADTHLDFCFLEHFPLGCCVFNQPHALGALVAASVGPGASSDAPALVMMLTKGRANCTWIGRVMSRAGARLYTGLTRGAAAPLEQPNPGTKEEIIFKNLCSLCREGPLGGRAPRLPPPPGVTGCD